MDRAHRIGQKRVVNVYRLITRGTIEEKIMNLQVSRSVSTGINYLFVLPFSWKKFSKGLDIGLEIKAKKKEQPGNWMGFYTFGSITIYKTTNDYYNTLQRALLLRCNTAFSGL